MLKNRTGLAILTTALFMLAISILSVSLPLSSTRQDSAGMLHFRLFIAPLIPGLHIIAAILFMQGLRGFKQELYKPYRLIAIGIILIGFAMLQSPIVTFFDLWDASFMRYGYITTPYIIATLFIYSGLRTFRRIIGVRSRWDSPPMVCGGIIASLLLVIALPHAASQSSEIVIDIRNCFFTLTACLAIVDAGSALAIRRHVAPAYAQTLGWLTAGLATQAILVFTSVIFTLLALDPRKVAELQDLLTLTPIPFIVAGCYFYSLTADTRTTAASNQGASVIDVVLYVASLSSNSAAVDPLLDKLRLVTTGLEPGQTPSATDKAALGDVYLALEQYLTTAEALRSFTAAELRSSVYRQFYHNNPADKAFWDKTPATAVGID